RSAASHVSPALNSSASLRSFPDDAAVLRMSAPAGAMCMERRTSLKRCAAGVNAAIAAIIAVPAVRYLLDPLARSRAGDRFIRVVPLSALTAGRPVRAAMIAERNDAHTHYPPGTIGQVFLTRDSDGARGPVRWLQTI